ncbi:MAG: sigma-54 dependent transcriptional regulator [Pseudomonadota bacterium]
MNEARTYKILIVDDSIHTQEVVQRNLTSAGYDAYSCESVEDAVRFLSDSTIDLVITDVKMPGRSGHDLVKHVRDHYSDLGIMMMTGYPDIADAVRAVKDGAAEYLVKPFTDEELLSAVHRMIEKISRRRTVRTDTEPDRSYGIIGASAGMQKVFHRIEKASATNATVLISGDSGTGKELVARAIHYNSKRRNAPFVTVNCTAIPESLLESELFGHMKGSFTGANETRKGFFQIADQGTIFLDEIGDASPNLQAKLLRVMQNKEIRMVGAGMQVQVDTRIIAATHKNLAALVEKNLFREDLFYRLNVIDINIPPLREREDDMLMMINTYVKKFAREMDRTPPAFSDNTLAVLKNYSWPGNVRELENLIQKLVVIVDGDVIRTSDLPENMRFNIGQPRKQHRKLDDVINEHIRNILTSVNGNKTLAATILGVDRKTLRMRLRKMETPDRPEMDTG